MQTATGARSRGSRRGERAPLRCHVLLDPSGVVVALQGASDDVHSLSFAARPGGDYLALCAAAPGPAADPGRRLAAAIRAVLDGGERADVAYTLPGPRGPRHYRSSVLPLEGDGAAVLVDHVDRTASRERSDALAIFQEVFAHGRETIGLLGPDGSYESQNAAHQRLLGFDDEDLIGRTPAIHLGEARFVEVAEALAARGEYSGVVESRRRDGVVRRLELSAFTVVDEDGAPLCFVGIKRDVTDRLEAEEELRRRESRQAVVNALLSLGLAEPGTLEDLLEGALDALLTSSWLDLSGRAAVLVADEAGALSPAAARGDLVLEPTGGDRCVCGERRDLRELVVCSGGPALPEPHAWMPVAQGDHLLAALVLGFQEDGLPPPAAEFLRVVAGTLAVTVARARAEEALRHSEARFRQLAESLPGASYQYQRNPDGTQEFPYVSSALGPLLGVDGARIAAEPEAAFQFVRPDELEALVRSIDESQAALSTWTREFRVRIPGEARERWLHARSNPARLPSGAVRWSGVVFDVTDRKQAEVELQEAKDAAEAAARAKTQFLANVSHELRTPLNAVIGMSGLLVETSGLSAEQREYAETIRSSADTLLLLIDDLLDVAKVDSGKMELERRPFDLRDCVETSLGLVAARAAEKEIGLSYAVDEGVPRRVRGDETRLRQVLSNLLSNAIKFTDEGEVHVAVGAATLGEERCELAFTVRDSGIGIPPERRDRLFKAFSQVDASTTRRFGGTGLGLAICKSLCELMGGSIGVESDVGRGSTFRFTVAVEPVAASPGAGPEPALDGRRVLVVEPHAASRRALVEQARAWGLRAEEAEPEAAAERLAAEPFDVVVVGSEDAPRGLDVLGRLRAAQGGTLQPPALLLHPVGRGRDDARAEELGVGASVTKPVRFAQLRGALGRLVTSSPDEAGRGGGQGRLELLGDPIGARFPARLLLVEDNPVNQRVARTLLERLGYAPDVASDGEEAIAAVERAQYDVVLMDLQMPRMDGLEATRRIRSGGAGRPRIVAMTADATPEGRAACREAGMDGYLSKPVRLEELQRVLVRQLRRAPAPVDRSVLASLREFTDPGAEGPDLATELIDVFLEDAPALVEGIRAGVAADDAEALKRAAHSLKGSCGSLGAGPLADMCAEVEGLARQGQVAGAERKVDGVAAELERVMAALRAERAT